LGLLSPQNPYFSGESHPGYDQAQGSGAVFSLTFQITLIYVIVFTSVRETHPHFRLALRKKGGMLGESTFSLLHRSQTSQHHLISGSWIFSFFFTMGQYLGRSIFMKLMYKLMYPAGGDQH
jgi:hypothetical protein